MEARTWWLASGHGRPACCTETCTSAELSSSTPIGWFLPPTAFSSESSFLGLQQRGWSGRGMQGERRKGGDVCLMLVPLGFVQEQSPNTCHS